MQKFKRNKNTIIPIANRFCACGVSWMQKYLQPRTTNKVNVSTQQTSCKQSRQSILYNKCTVFMNIRQWNRVVTNQKLSILLSTCIDYIHLCGFFIFIFVFFNLVTNETILIKIE